MANNSTTAGFLSPVSSDLYDDALDNIFQAAVVGITQIPGALVRPRWQPEPPNQPDFTVNWCAFGIVRREADVMSYESASSASVTVDRDETMYVLHSFYGPLASTYCELFRDGLEVTQNRDTLAAAGVYLASVQEAVVLPALLQNKWVKRVDTTVVYRRRTSRTFQIDLLSGAQIGLYNEHYVTPITVQHP